MFRNGSFITGGWFLYLFTIYIFQISQEFPGDTTVSVPVWTAGRRLETVEATGDQDLNCKLTYFNLLAFCTVHTSHR